MFPNASSGLNLYLYLNLRGTYAPFAGGLSMPPFQGAYHFQGYIIKMDRFAVLVDAGYLFSQTVKILSAKASNSRADLRMTNADDLVKMLVSKASCTLNNPNLLRVYWYDGVGSGLSADHKRLIEVDDVQFRAGKINGQGQQKGVDSMIVTDLMELATHRAISDALVVTGDSDLAIGIEQAQRRGVRVAVLGIEEMTSGIGVHHGQSFEITSLADRVVRIGQAELSPSLQYAPAPTVSPPPQQLQVQQLLLL